MMVSSEDNAPSAEGLIETFHLKTDDKTKSADNEKRKGRLYDAGYSRQPGAVRVDEMLFGLKMAHLSCTDDTEERLAKAGTNNTFEALKWIVGGGDEEAKRPLSELLRDHFSLRLDCWMDESGLFHGRPVDTQGFVASNDEIIVVSYRFTTSKFDWLTNLSMTTSEWEPERDAHIGHAGYCSCVDGLISNRGGRGRKPRVHTGFYNNFIHTVSSIRKYVVEPLLQKDATPKKVFITGCSLGAAIATMAFCYVVMEVPLETLEHKVVLVTAGCPRVCNRKMRQVMTDRLQALRPLDRAVVCRLVYNEDLVAHIPFHVLGFYHLDKLVYITKNGEVMVNPHLKTFFSIAEVKQVIKSFSKEKKKTADKADKAEEEEGEGKTQFEKECETTPGPIKDHMPYWYLTFLDKLLKENAAGEE